MVSGIAGVSVIGASPVLANGGSNGNGAGNSSASGSSSSGSGAVLQNAEWTANGGIVATGDEFVIAGQTIEIDSTGPTVGIDIDGYSGRISNNHLSVLAVPANPTFGIRTGGGDVTVRGNVIDGASTLGKQFLSIGAVGGVTGKIEENTLNGGHRVGILASGSGTAVSIRGNDVVGLGPKTTGWAENGIQISYGAKAKVRENTVAEHWWDLDDFQSAGIILYQPADSVHIQRNEIRNNDAGVALWGGDEHNVLQNTIEVTEADPGENGVFHAGVIALSTTDSGVRQNTIQAVDGDAGIYLYSSAVNTKLIANDVSGFDQPIVDNGAETKLPAPFDPDADNGA